MNENTSKLRKPVTMADLEPKVEELPPESTALIEADPYDVSPQVNSLWQVKNPESKLFGLILTVGAHTADELHGYYISPGRLRDYATVPLADCTYVGEAHVKSKNPCSKEWLEAHSETKTREIQ